MYENPHGDEPCTILHHLGNQAIIHHAVCQMA